jgi:hypothetical protein
MCGKTSVRAMWVRKMDVVKPRQFVLERGRDDMEGSRGRDEDPLTIGPTQ